MSELDRVRELLAFHAQGVLRGDDLAFVDHWLDRNGRDHPEITAELAWLRSTAAQLQSQVEMQSRLETFFLHGLEQQVLLLEQESGPDLLAF